MQQLFCKFPAKIKTQESCHRNSI